MAVLAALGSSLINLVLVIAFVNIPVYIKLTRSAVLPLRDSDYVHAARCAGNSTMAIIRRHILPNVYGVILAHFPSIAPGPSKFWLHSVLLAWGCGCRNLNGAL